jgi:hypothetical protein
MPAPVAVVILTLDVADRLGPCLAALTEGAIEGVVGEVVFADGGSGDGVAALAEAVGARLIVGPPGRGSQIAAGIAATSAPWVLVLHADTVLAPGWPRAVVAHMQARPQQAGFATLAFDAAGGMATLTAGWANLRSAAFALPYGDQALLIPRALHDAIGGYPDVPLMEDVILARRLGRRRLARLATVATTSAERYRAEGWWWRGWRNLTTLGLFLIGVPPHRLARRYDGAAGPERGA